MIYGKAKVRTMQRSILPSSARKGARDDKRALIHRNRRSNRHAMTKYRGPAPHVEEVWEDGEQLTYWETPLHHDYGEIIFARRNNDKLAHFEMWAYKRTLHLRVEDRYSKMAGILPNGVIGNHALSHLDFLKPPHPRWSYGMRDYSGLDQGLPSQLRKSYRIVLREARMST